VHEASGARRKETIERLTWSQRIRDALEGDGLTLYAQPILDLATGQIARHELLLRMIGTDGRVIPPGAFLPTAERFGLIQEIDRWVVRRAVALIAKAQGEGCDHCFEVNLSGHSVADPDLPDLIRKEVESAGVEPSGLTFEVTETAAIANMTQAQSFAATLSSLGCGFAIDDFGSGFGSFYYLKHLPADIVKIDGDFIRELPRSRVDQLVVESMVQIANGLGMRTVAEFALDDETIAALRKYGVDFAQGYGVGEPRPAEELFTAPATVRA
jgi:EAL domain-containing protein (putative c-di-GMP-specific phosphodiesterase class I)